MDKLTLTQPDDWHLHVRNGSVLKTVIAHTANQFARAIIMPNLKPPISKVNEALNYRSEIIQALPMGTSFNPLMTLYLTAKTTVNEVKKVANSEYVHAFKLYPAGVTTNSDAGVNELKSIYPILEAMQQVDVPLLIHAEVSDNGYDIFDREKVFIESSLADIVKTFPKLRVVVEHVTTKEAVDFVLSASDKVAATITPQHLMFNRNAIFVGGIRPHHYCLPIIKREHHRLALIKVAISGNPKFFLGTDSAPHLTSDKENSCGCAGCYSAYAALELYAEVFEKENALDKLEGFASFFGADFYQLPRNKKTVTLHKQTWTVPASYPIDNETITPLKANENLSWKLYPIQ
ncbi:MAG: dihydroorotase [Methylococcales symbiont of Iophon sp. n. MRB-2018]|nr:MAG: dihydroorotase [Methylococcales symbiont of Iophon sp. n. MRB-2018]KAF3980657.1 MAG: dihydroorotase [Methylococcales symbiont of Iophon sp. n. MRB-2018]